MVFLPPSRRIFGLGTLLFILDSLGFFRFLTKLINLLMRSVDRRGRVGPGTSSGGDISSLSMNWPFFNLVLLKVMSRGVLIQVMGFIRCLLPGHLR